MRGIRAGIVVVCGALLLTAAASTASVPAAAMASVPFAAVAPAPEAPSAPPTAIAVAGPQGGELLGFGLDEERRYVLGPAEALSHGELAIWIIRLERIERTATGPRGHFVLQHRREAPRSIDDPPRSGEVTIAQVDAELVVNGHGAPMQVVYTAQRHIFDVGDELFQVTYRHTGNRYEKKVALQGAEWDFDVDVLEYAGVDGRIPIGFFAYAPDAAECLEWLTGTLVQRRTGTGDTGPGETVQRVDRQGRAVVEDAALAAGTCYERNIDPAFAHPGLLSLGMPLLWERRGDSELVLFAPLRPDLVRGQDNGVPVTFAPIIPSVPNVPGSNPLIGSIPGLDLSMLFGGGGTDGDRDRARDPSRHFRPRRLWLSERQRIEVGARKMEALPLRIEGFAGTAWVDDWGKVLRVDLAGTGLAGRHLRLQHPSEY